MKSLRSIAVVVALAAASFGPAYAGDPLVVVDVDPVPVKVTFSRTGLTTLTTFAAYVASINNASGRTLNHVLFEATPTVYRDGNVGLITAPFIAAASSPGCAPSGDKVICELGQMANGQSRSLVLVFPAPEAPTTAYGCSNVWAPALTANGWVAQSPGSPTNCDRIALAWTYHYGEGSNDNREQSSHTDFTSGLTFTALGTPTGTQVWSWVPPNPLGTTFFTGNLGVAGTLFGSVVDLATTTVFVPASWIFPSATQRTAQVDETEAAGTIASTLTLPGSASGTNYLEITLRRDVSTIPTGFQLRDWVITYQHTPTSALINPVLLCSRSTPSLPLPRSGLPCEIDGSRIEYKRNNAPTPDYIGDFEAKFRAVDNGKFAM